MVPEQEVAVIIPFSREYTPPEMLAEAKESVHQQEVQTEIIEVGDGSNPAMARNIGLDRAGSRYVAFLDADDVWRPDKLSRQLERMTETGSGLCLEGESMTRDDFFHDVFIGQHDDIMSSIVIDTEQVSTRFEEQLDRWEDHLFAFEAAAAGVCFCPDTFVYRKHADSVTAGDIDPYFYLAQGKLYASLVFDRVPEARPYVHSFYRDLYFRAGYHFHYRGEYETAQTYLKRSLQIGPTPKPMIGLVGTTVYSVLERFGLDYRI